MTLTLARSPEGRILTDQYGMSLYQETPLDPPPGKAMGALPMDCAPTNIGELFVDKFRRKIIDLDDWPELIAAEGGDHLEFRDEHVYDQDGVGSCAAEGFCNCVMSNRVRRNQDRVLFNPWPLYYFSSGGRDNGSSLSANIREAKRVGLIPMELWPRPQHRWNDVPPSSSSIWKEAAKYKPDEVWPLGNIQEAGTAMFLGHAVYAAYPGHAWQLVKLLNTQQALWLNSWGAGWGDNGVAVINLSRLQFSYGLWAIQTTSVRA